MSGFKWGWRTTGAGITMEPPNIFIGWRIDFLPVPWFPRRAISRDWRFGRETTASRPRIFLKPWPLPIPSPHGPRALAAAALVRLERDDPQGAREALQRFLTGYPDQVWAPQVRGAFALLAGYEELPQKSEVLAGVLSGILPGAGYAYAGDYATGFMSLLVNGAFIAGTWTAFAQGLDALGVLAGGMGLPFYIGNIYGSAQAARKWNQQTLRQAREPIYSALRFVFE